ncbi:response regulator [Paraburkholderia phymatum]|uniref:Response regulator receiver protein n=1 Tax=Paraburkholderia phymatum (strain DSM 17167 / CIP 108236 / LMG 21445 / STM815) TaxID=391038 RepID=B2JQA8_PARP8|nr:hybrid sensor histidine kinase/response regulator [Paraburkholderia phymatum]ACC73449.1 response regulator receiver protein [Paraburkholderia phymatum STM815]
MNLRPSGTASLLARTFGLKAPIGALALFGSFAAYDEPLAGSAAAALLLLARGLCAAAHAHDAQRRLELQIEHLDALLRTVQQDNAALKEGYAQTQREAAQTERAAALADHLRVLQGAQCKIVSCARALSNGLDADTGWHPPLHSAAETFVLVAHDALDTIPPTYRDIVFDEDAVDLRELIDGAALLVAPTAVARRVRLQVCIDRSIAARVLADRARLGQIVFNLLSYTAEAAGPGVVTLSARAESLNTSAQRIVIGINGAAAASVANASTAEMPAPHSGAHPAILESAGLREHPDLALARVIARKMGGDITILEGKRVGVCVALHAPFTIEQHEWPVRGHERRWASVDLDNYADRQSICELLRKLGITTLPSDTKPPVQIDYRFVEAGQAPSTHGEKRLIVVTRDALPGGMRNREGRIELSLNPLSWAALRRICDAHGGADDKPAVHDVPLRVHVRPPSNRPNILVVDDNDVNRKVLARQLDVLGYRCVSASSGEEALGVLRRGRVDLLITDLQMPGMSGVELARRVRASFGGSGHEVPVILLSATPDTKLSDSERTLFGAVLVKTSGLQALDAALARLIPDAARHSAAPTATRLEKYDFTALDSLAAQGVHVDGLLQDWQQTMEADLDHLAQQRASGDVQGSRRALHRLAGAVGIVGNHGLMHALQRTSTAPEGLDDTLLDGLVERIRTQMNDLVRRAEGGHSGT